MLFAHLKRWNKRKFQPKNKMWAHGLTKGLGTERFVEGGGGGGGGEGGGIQRAFFSKQGSFDLYIINSCHVE